MAYENTHIYLADEIRKKIGNHTLKQMISDHRDFYYLGSIFPDILFYSKDEQVSKIAYNLHGEDGVPTSRIIFKLLDEIRIKKDKNNFSFIAGFLTHCAVDITIHPMVFYVSGYKVNGNKQEKDRASYLHWHYEASIDQLVNHHFSLDKIINPELLKELIIPKVIGIHVDVIGKALKRQINYISLTPSRFYYIVFKALCKLGLYPAGAIAGFNRNLEKERIRLPDPIQYKDLLTGEPKQTTLNDLMAEAVQFGCRMIETAYEYYEGRENREQCEKIIGGQSLETGRVGKRMSDIRFSADLYPE
jgi:hypothetical protein